MAHLLFPAALPDEALRVKLEHLYASFPYAERLATDPLRGVLRYSDPRDQEVAGLPCALLAYGRVELFLPKLDQVLQYMDRAGGPRAFVEGFSRAEQPWLDDFRYRMTSGAELTQLFVGMQRVIRTWGTLEAAFAAQFSVQDRHIGRALDAWVRLLAPQEGCTRAFRHLLPDPGLGSACKRLMLYLRWMVRRQEGMDPGCWPSIPASHLLVPLDTHTLRLWHNLRLTQAQSARLQVAEEITVRLRAWDPADPVRFDFAVCHLGMSGGCPVKRSARICQECPLKSECRWGEGLGSLT